MKERLRVEVAPGTVQGEMPEESAAGHAVTHRRAYRTSRPSERCGYAVVGPLAAFDDVLVVAGEDLVAAIPGEDDFHVLGRQLRHHVGGDG